MSTTPVPPRPKPCDAGVTVEQTPSPIRDPGSFHWVTGQDEALGPENEWPIGTETQVGDVAIHTRMRQGWSGRACDRIVGSANCILGTGMRDSL